MIDIRPEVEADYERVHAITEAAFAPMPFSNVSEPRVIRTLREDSDVTLALVAQMDSRPVGHIMFSPIKVTDGGDGWIALGPVSVDPDHQKQGVGHALIVEGLKRIERTGAPGCILIGNPAYYSRFGFIGDGRITYRDLPAPVVQWLSFGQEKPGGEVTFAPGLE